MSEEEEQLRVRLEKEIQAAAEARAQASKLGLERDQASAELSTLKEMFEQRNKNANEAWAEVARLKKETVPYNCLTGDTDRCATSEERSSTCYAHLEHKFALADSRADRLAAENKKLQLDLSGCAADYEMYGDPEDLAKKNDRLAAEVESLKVRNDEFDRDNRRLAALVLELEAVVKLSTLRTGKSGRKLDVLAKVEAAREDGLL